MNCTFRLDRTTARIVWSARNDRSLSCFSRGSRLSATESSLSVYDITEVRMGKLALLSKGFRSRNQAGEVVINKDLEDLAFTIAYGRDFVQEELCLVAFRDRHFDAWTVGLRACTRVCMRACLHTCLIVTQLRMSAEPCAS